MPTEDDAGAMDAGPEARREIYRRQRELGRRHASPLARAGRLVRRIWSRAAQVLPERLAAAASAVAAGAAARWSAVQATLRPPAPAAGARSRANAFDVVCFAAGAWHAAAPGSRRLASDLAAAGHRVFVVPPQFRQAGPRYELEPLAENVQQAWLQAPAPDAGAASARGPEEAFASLDALRRDLGLGATLALVQAPSWRPLAERAARELAWPLIDDAIAGGRHDDRDGDAADHGRQAFPPLSVVVVTFNNASLNRECLESLFQRTEWPNLEVIVVDNGSRDATPDELRAAQRRHPGLKLILNDANRGFAAAANQGLAQARGEYLALLNNDTLVTRGLFAALIRHLHADPGLGLVGPATNAISNAAQVRVGYRDVADMPAWAADHVRRHDRELSPLPMLALFCAAFRRELYRRVGPLDERFAVGMFEDDDYCRRVRELGYRIACARDAFVHHWQRASFRLLGTREYLRVFDENKRRYEAKWREPWRGEGVAVWRRGSGREQRQLESLRQRALLARGVVVFPASVGWRIHLFQRPHHLARAFARSGYLAVFDCSNARGGARGFEEIEPDLFLFRGRAALLRELPDPLLWTFPYNFHLSADYPAGTRTVYDWIDDLAVFPQQRGFLETNHRLGLADASLVCAVTRELHARALAARPDALYLPNAVEYQRFAEAQPEPPADAGLARLRAGGRPVAGYYGALASWFDHELLDAVARERPDWGFGLIGPMLDARLKRSRLLSRANVAWLGPRRYEELPGYLQRFDVATIPFRINPITLATSPLKLYEYMAGAKPVVATPLPECQAFPEVRIARDAPEFSTALDAARAQAGDPGFRERLRALARANSWSVRVELVKTRLERR